MSGKKNVFEVLMLQRERFLNLYTAMTISRLKFQPFKKLLPISLSLLLLAPSGFAAVTPSSSQEVKPQSGSLTLREAPQLYQLRAEQAANILDVGKQFDRLQDLEKNGDSGESSELLATRALVLQKILRGYLDLRTASSQLAIERAYTYDIMQRAQRKQQHINDFFNFINFMQFGTLYTMEGFSRLESLFIQSAVLTCVSSSLGLGFPTISIVQQKLAKVHDVAPPAYLHHYVTGESIDRLKLPDTINKYLDLPEPGDKTTRRAELHASWKDRYGVDYLKSKNICNLRDGRSQSIGALNTRILLLWSLDNAVQQMNHELLALLSMMPPRKHASSTLEGGVYTLSPAAADAARLLNIQAESEELIALNKSHTHNKRHSELELRVLEELLTGCLETAVAASKVNEELNYAYDVALSQMLYKRGKNLQRTFEANFIENGVFGCIAGEQYLLKRTKTGNEMFVISSAIGTGLSTLALWQTHGGKRKVDTPPNSLADFFRLEPTEEYRFSPLMSAYLNSSDPLSKSGKSRRDELFDIWKANKVATVKFEDKKVGHRLAAMPDSKYDTIKILRNRITLLHSVNNLLEAFDTELYALAKETGVTPDQAVAADESTISPNARQTADLLGVGPLLGQVSIKRHSGMQLDNGELLEEQLALDRRVLSALLDLNSTTNRLDLVIRKEEQILDRMTRNRDLGIALTNNANFFQISILGMIIDGPLGLNHSHGSQIADDRLTVVSGLTAAGLATAALLQQRGGFRPNKSQPNEIGQVFGLEAPSECRLSPLMVQYLNSSNPDTREGLTHREELVQYWKKAKVLDINVNKPSNVERLSACGKRDHHWTESMKLIRNRITMLYDLRATMDSLCMGLSNVLHETE